MMRQLGAMRTAGDGEFGDAGILVAPDYFQWVRYEIVADATAIIQQTASMIVIDRAPRIGVYSSNEDAVTRTMDDAGLPYTIFHEEEILAGCLANYDWLHVHHEDFTGQGGDGGLAVPTLVSVSDKTGATADGPAGGTVWIKASGFSTYEDGNRNIKVWFENTQLRLATTTATYSTDALSADKYLVTATDNGEFEVTALVPTLPNGTYRVYAQVKDEYRTTSSHDLRLVGAARDHGHRRRRGIRSTARRAADSSSGAAASARARPTPTSGSAAPRSPSPRPPPPSPTTTPPTGSSPRTRRAPGRYPSRRPTGSATAPSRCRPSSSGRRRTSSSTGSTATATP
jgi:hypothetical protein